MNDMNPTYASEDGVHYAIVAGKVIASGTDFDEVEREVKLALAADTCPRCGGTGKEKLTSCEECGGTGTKTKAASKSATHIVTPNGVKGQILSRTAALWGDEVTVRFDNGQIHSVAVTDRTQFTVEKHKTASSKPADRLRSELEKTASGGRKSLSDRIITLGRVKDEAYMLIAGGVSNDEARDLHEIVLMADHEVGELREAIDHIDATEGEGYVPYHPDVQIIDGPNIGHDNDGTWLDHTLNEMIAEAEGTDFDALLDDGPTLLTAEVPDSMIADGGAVREMALSFVQSKTAGLEGETIEKFEDLFIARCEDARRVELAHRTATTKKEAAQKKSHVDDAPVESLFM